MANPLTPEELATIRGDWLLHSSNLNICEHSAEAASTIGKLLDHIDYCASVLNAPEVEDFLMGVQLEAAHQEQRWGTEHDEGKKPEDWLWLIGYLVGKAVRAANDGDADKHRHHCISSAAVLANWHRHAGKFQPGHAPASVTGVNPSSLNEG